MLVRTPSLQLGVLQSLQGSFLLHPILLSHLALFLIPLVEARVKTYEFITIYYMAQVGHKGVNPFTVKMVGEYSLLTSEATVQSNALELPCVF